MNLHNIFLDEVQRKISLLIEKYNFSIDSISKENLFPSVLVRRNDIAIEITFEIREQIIFLYFAKLQKGEIPSYLDNPDKWINMEEILKLKEKDISSLSNIDLLQEKNIKETVNNYIRLCEEYCHELLEGDVSIFDKVIKQRQK